MAAKKKKTGRIQMFQHFADDGLNPLGDKVDEDIPAKNEIEN